MLNILLRKNKGRQLAEEWTRLDFLKMKVINVNNDGSVEEEQIEEQQSEFDKSLLTSEEYKNIHAMVATPCYGGLIHQGTVSGFLASMYKALHNGISLDFRFLSNESLIPRGRNNLVCQFLASDATHLIFVDADIEFQPESLLRLAVADREVVAGAYPTKSTPPRYVVDFKEDAKIDKENFTELERAGTGFLCIKRCVFEKMKEAYPELHYTSDIDAQYGFDSLPEENRPTKETIQKLKDNLYSFFDTSHHPETNEYLSEDYTFCHRWKKIGGKIWLDTTCHLSHVGTVNFTVTAENMKTALLAKKVAQPPSSDNE